ncbi:hypothetical protein D3C87_1768380 [compost metagenome]
MIFGNQNGQRAIFAFGRRSARSLLSIPVLHASNRDLLIGRFRQRQKNMDREEEFCPFPFIAFHTNHPAQQFNQLFADRQPQARAAILAVN